MQQMHELRLRQPSPNPVGIDTGDQAGHGMGQYVLGKATINTQGLADLLKVLIGAHTSYLQRPITSGIDSGGLEVIPENTLAHQHLLPCFLSSGSGYPNGACQAPTGCMKEK